MEIIVFTLNAIVIYFVADRVVRLIEQRRVKTGTANWDHTEITDGLQEGREIRAFNFPRRKLLLQRALFDEEYDWGLFVAGKGPSTAGN